MESDFTQSLLDKTDALIAKHRQPKGAVMPTPEGAMDDIKDIPVLQQKLTPEEAIEWAKKLSGEVAATATDPKEASPEAIVETLKEEETPITKKALEERISAGPEELPIEHLGENTPKEEVSKNESVPNTASTQTTATQTEANLKRAGYLALSSQNVDKIVERIAPELADLVVELAREISGSVIRQMTPRIHEIVSKRSRELITESLRVSDSKVPQKEL